MKTVVKYSLAVWILFGALIVWIISPVENMASSILRVSSMLVPMMFLFYLNLMLFSPRYLDKKNNIKYYFAIFLSILIYILVGGLLDIYMDKIYPINIHNFSSRPLHLVFVSRLMSSIPPLVISALISRTILLRKKEAESLDLKNKMLEAETKALKAQINPHFLFNSLNNIYSLAQLKSDKTPDAILQLSDLLRYVTYDGNQNFVELNKELNVIHNFIELQYLKDDYKDNIKVDIETDKTHWKIAPLLLIPFIENSFKHSNFEDREKGWIKIHIRMLENRLFLKCSNSIGHIKNAKKDQTGGIGMDNVKKRLNLLYEDKHELKILKSENKYAVDLEIQLDK